MDQSRSTLSGLSSPTGSSSQESRTLSDRSRLSSQTNSPILPRCESPVVPDDESLEEGDSSDECRAFYEYADDRNPLVWYRISLLSSFASFPRIPGAVSRLIKDLKSRQAATHPPRRSRMRDRDELHKNWQHSKREDIRLYFQGPESSLFPGGHPIAQHDINGEVVYHHMMRRVDGQTLTEDFAPDVIHGYQEDTLVRAGGIPSWVLDDGKATKANLFYPFLTVQIQDHDLRSEGDMQKAADECMIASSISVRMLDKLNQRLTVCHRGEQFTTVNSAAFSIAMNGAVTRLYVTFAWDETKDYVYNVASFVLADPSHHRKLHRYVRSIIDWGTNERLEEIRDAIEVIETDNPPWYPRYQK